MTDRRRLSDRRLCESFSFQLDGLRFTASVGRFPDGRIGELFLSNHKSGNQSDTNARDAAILLSFALQHGADIDEIREALCRNSAGRALGPMASTAISLTRESASAGYISPGIQGAKCGSNLATCLRRLKLH
jgi:hypothetical protein